ncbi:MAG: SLATT domain-containing protein [Sulfuriferula sp.]
MAHVSLNQPTNAVDLLQSWRHRARLNQKAHYVMVHRAEFRVFWFGVTSAVISGVVGLLILITKETQASDWVHIGAGGISIFASVVTAIATSGKWSEKAAQHHAAAAAYGNVHRRFEQALAVPPVNEEALHALIEELRKELEAIPMNAPPIPASVWKKVPDEITPSHPNVSD